MEFLVEFDIRVPDATSDSELKARVNAEAQASAELARNGHLVRLWSPPVAPGERKALGLYRAQSKEDLDGMLRALPLNDWMRTVVTPLETHPNDPTKRGANDFHLPSPRLTPVYRLEATLGQPLELGDTKHGHRCP